MSLEGLLDLAKGYLEIGDYDRTIYLLESTTSVYPNCAELYNIIGIAYDNTKRHDRAVMYFDKALELEPKNGILLGNKACSLRDAGRTKEALALYEYAMEMLLINKDKAAYINALAGFVYALAIDGQPERAAIAYTEAARLGYKDAEVQKQWLLKRGIQVH